MLKKTGNTKQLVPRPKVDNASQIKQPNAEVCFDRYFIFSFVKNSIFPFFISFF